MHAHQVEFDGVLLSPGHYLLHHTTYRHRRLLPGHDDHRRVVSYRVVFRANRKVARWAPSRVRWNRTCPQPQINAFHLTQRISPLSINRFLPDSALPHPTPLDRISIVTLYIHTSGGNLLRTIVQQEAATEAEYLPYMWFPPLAMLRGLIWITNGAVYGTRLGFDNWTTIGDGT